MLSGELATLLSGRYIEVKMLLESVLKLSLIIGIQYPQKNKRYTNK